MYSESCPIWVSHVPYEWVMSHTNEACHTWMNHVPYEWAMSHMNESCHTWMSHVTYEWVTGLLSHYVCKVSRVACIDACSRAPQPGEERSRWDMTRAHGTWLIHIGHDSFIWDTTLSADEAWIRNGTWLIPTGHDSFIRGITHSHDIYIRRAIACRLLSMLLLSMLSSDMPHKWVCPIRMSHVPYKCVMSHMNKSCPSGATCSITEAIVIDAIIRQASSMSHI